MKDEFTNRLGMFDTTLLNVNTAANKAVWFEKDPLIFTAKITAAAAAVAELRKFCTKQSADIADRKSLTLQMRERFNTVEAKFVALDDLILQFNGTEAGRALIASHQEARIVRDLGAGPGEPEAPAPAPEPPTPPQ